MTGKKRYVSYAFLSQDQLIDEIQRLEGENRALTAERETARDWAVRLENENRQLETSLAEQKALARSQMTRIRDLTDFNQHLTDPGHAVALMQQLAGEVWE